MIEVISAGILDDKMEALGYKNIKTSVLGPPIVIIPPACGDGHKFSKVNIQFCVLVSILGC